MYDKLIDFVKTAKVDSVVKAQDLTTTVMFSRGLTNVSIWYQNDDIVIYIKINGEELPEGPFDDVLRAVKQRLQDEDDRKTQRLLSCL